MINFLQGDVFDKLKEFRRMQPKNLNKGGMADYYKDLM